MKHGWLFLFFVLAWSLPAQAQESNLIDTCVSSYDATTDYFPEKATIDYATGFTVEYHANYKVVTVVSPFPGATPDDGFQYVLVQCGTPTPEGFDNAQIVEVPVGNIISLSTTFLPHLVELDLLDRLVGVDTLAYTSTPEVLEKGANGQLLEVGSGSTINVELVLSAEPDLVMANASGSPEFDAHPILLDADIPVAISADYVEQDPLGRAEWVKFTALFYNKEAQAQTLMDTIAQEYLDLLKLTADLPAEVRPLVLWDSYSTYSNAWYVPGSETYMARLFMDAGIDYVLMNGDGIQGYNGSLPLDFEAIYEEGIHADIWMPSYFGVTNLADLLAQDERYADFGAFQSGQVFTNGARATASGGNDFYENGVLNPQVVLADLIKIAYPDLLPDYELTYFTQLQ